MKKILSMLVVATLIVAMFAFSASATGADTASGITGSGDVSIEVSGTPVHKYAVDIEFQTLAFTYSTGSTWNPSTHQYDVNEGGSWSAAKTITIKNHSDMSVSYSSEVTDKVTTYGSLEINLDKPTGTINPCTAGTAVGSEPSETIKVTITGTPTKGEISSTKLGKITINMADVG